MSIVVSRAAPSTAVSLVSVTNTVGSFQIEKYPHVSTELLSDQSSNNWSYANSFTYDEEGALDFSNHELLYQHYHRNSLDSLFSLPEETTHSEPSSYTSSPNLSPSLKEVYKVKNSLCFKAPQPAPLELVSNATTKKETTQIQHHAQRRKSSISFSGTLSPTEYHPLNTIYELDKDSKELLPIAKSTFSIGNKHNAQKKNKSLSLPSKFISFLKMMSGPAEVSLKSKKLILQTVPDCGKAKRPTLLETFSQDFERLPLIQEKIVIDDPNSDTLLPLRLLGKTNRVRQQRINSNYLLIYALDKSAEKYLADVEECEINTFDQLLLENYHQLINESSEMIPASCIFDLKFKWKLLSVLQLENGSKIYDEEFIQLLKLASIARYKLWSSITLPPRSDELPNIGNLTKNIVPATSLEFCEVPWLSLNDLKKGKAVKKLSNSAGFLRNSNIQFVSKDSQSKRWTSYTIPT